MSTKFYSLTLWSQNYIHTIVNSIFYQNIISEYAFFFFVWFFFFFDDVRGSCIQSLYTVSLQKRWRKGNACVEKRGPWKCDGIKYYMERRRQSTFNNAERNLHFYCCNEFLQKVFVVAPYINNSNNSVTGRCKLYIVNELGWFTEKIFCFWNIML